MGLKRWVYLKLWWSLHGRHRSLEFTWRPVLLKWMGDMYLQGYPVVCQEVCGCECGWKLSSLPPLMVSNSNDFWEVLARLAFHLGGPMSSLKPIPWSVECDALLDLGWVICSTPEPWWVGWGVYGVAYPKLKGWEKRSHVSSEENPDMGQKMGEWLPGRQT